MRNRHRIRWTPLSVRRRSDRRSASTSSPTSSESSAARRVARWARSGRACTPPELKSASHCASFAATWTRRRGKCGRAAPRLHHAIASASSRNGRGPRSRRSCATSYPPPRSGPDGIDSRRMTRTPRQLLRSSSRQSRCGTVGTIWAVRAARAGTPVAVMRAQLGHSSPVLTLSVYGRFLPTADEQGTWERRATEQEGARRSPTAIARA